MIPRTTFAAQACSTRCIDLELGRSANGLGELCNAKESVIRKFKSFLLLGLVSLMPGIAWGQDAKPRKKVIAWGGIDWYSPATVQRSIRTIEKLPFDGTVLQGFQAKKNGKKVWFDWRCFGKEKFERRQLASTIKTLKSIDFRKFTDNFLRYNVTPGDVDWFDDFGAILHNARMWAEVTRDTGMKGWMFDVEDYKGTVFDYRKMKYAKKKNFAQYSNQARLRGRQFMEAVQKGYPNIVILLALAHSYVNRTPEAPKRLAELEYGLLPAFLNGMLETAGPRVRIIDGHEQGYGYLTSEEYFRGYIATQKKALALVPRRLQGKYRAKIEVGMAVNANYVFGLTSYPGHWPTHYLTRKERRRIFEQNMYYALKLADEYVWLYSEHLGWWTQHGYAYPIPDGAIEAIRSAQHKIRKNQPLGFHVLAERILRAKATLKVANPYPSRDSIVPRVRKDRAPVIDGILKVVEWKTVPPLLPFARRHKFMKSNRPATLAKATFDNNHLYIAIH